MWQRKFNLCFAGPSLIAVLLYSSLVSAADSATKPNDPPPVAPATQTSDAAPPKPAKPPAVTPIELRPYRVHVSVAFEEDASLSRAVRKDLLDKLAIWIDSTYAQMWDVSIEENLWLNPVGLSGLWRINAAVAESHVPDKSIDKLLVATVAPHGGGWTISGREWDRLTGQVSAPATRLATNHRNLSNDLGAVLRDLFHPLVFIESVEKGKATVRIRAGEFPAADPAADQWAAASFFQPVFLNYNKDREVTKVQFVPWTYLEAQTSDRAIGQGIVHTGLSLPLGKNSKRMESWAIGVRPTFSETRLKITPHNNPNKPLTGYSVNVYERQMLPPPPPDPNAAAEAAKNDSAKSANAASDNKSDDPKTDAKEGESKPPEQPALVPQFVKVAGFTTDRRGQVTIKRNPDKPMIWLYVSSGGSLLGRFPYLPGLTPNSSVELPDDSLRLNIESRLELLRAEFIDTVARRALLTGRAKALARAADWPKFNETLAELDQQPNGKYFHTLLDAIKAATIKQAQAAKNKALEKKIEKLSKETAELIERLLSVEKLDTARNELLELKQLDDEAKASASPNARQAVPRKSAEKEE